MKLFFLLPLLVSSISLACEVHLPLIIVVLGEGAATSHISSRDCSPELITELNKVLSEVEGRLTSFQLQDMVSSRGHSAFELTPNSVDVQQLRSIIREQLPLPTGIQVKTTRGINMPNLVALAPGEKVEISCPSCLYGLHEPLNISIRGRDGINKSFIARADFSKMVRAYRATSTITTFSEISAVTDLREEFVESVPHTDFITDTSVLKFYKSNKPIKAGELLRYSDLNAINLVKAGLKTDVILENSMVKIKTQGISRSNGSIGETVEVYHPQKNMKYQGKVIDINKVLVEL